MLLNFDTKNIFHLPSFSKSSFRLGRGVGSGKGKTSSAGHKGQKSRAGRYNLNIRGYGSQTSFSRLLPKRGFKSNKNTTMTISFESLFFLASSNGNRIDYIFLRTNFPSFLSFRVICSGKTFDMQNFYFSGFKASPKLVEQINMSGGVYDTCN